MPVPAILDAALAEYQRRDAAWNRRIAQEWTPERRGQLEAAALRDLALWEAVAEFVGPDQVVPGDPEACWQATRKRLDQLLTKTPYDAPIEQQQTLTAIWRLERTLSRLAANIRDSRALSARLHPERTAA